MKSIQRTHIFIGGAIVALMVILGFYFFVMKTPITSATTDTGSTIMNPNLITFDGKGYTKGFTLPKQGAPEYTNESYEWVTGGETVQNWKTLITTHKLTPRDTTRSLSAAAYAPNVAIMNEKRGATIIEKSVINSPDASKSGIEVNNPPYILVYAFPVGDQARSTEIAIQKIQNSNNNTLEIFISAQRMIFKTPDEVNTYLKSEAYLKRRTEVISAHVPY